MTALRSYTTLDPNIWRFPQWKNRIFYPSGSFVALATYNPLDSEQVVFSYYVSLIDVAVDCVDDGTGNAIAGSGSFQPDSDSDWTLNSIYNTNPWVLAFDTTADAISADLIAKIDALTGLFPLLGIDSDIGLLFRADSDFRVKDSEQDSDILKAFHDAWAWDSDRDSEARRRLDSEVHERKAADSDLQIQIWDNDSDILMEIHDRKAADSDLWVADSEQDSDIRMLRHDAIGWDSDIRNYFMRRVDSDSDRLRNFIKRYTERDSDIALKFKQHDSDIAYLYLNGGASGSQGGNGFPVGTVMMFAHTAIPTGFHVCDGSTFSSVAYPELFTKLGDNLLPDLRGQFIRGWSDDNSVDPDGPRAPRSSQQDSFKAHTHTYVDQQSNSTDADWGSDRSTRSGDISRTSGSTGGDETRPKNIAMVFAIAMYQGAGAVYDSETIEAVLKIRLADYDSDLIALYNRTNFYSETYAPTTDQAVGSTLVVGSSSTLYDDIEVLLNGVQVTQWTASGTTFTFNFFIRGNQDVIVIKMRR